MNEARACESAERPALDITLPPTHRPPCRPSRQLLRDLILSSFSTTTNNRAQDRTSRFGRARDNWIKISACDYMSSITCVYYTTVSAQISSSTNQGKFVCSPSEFTIEAFTNSVCLRQSPLLASRNSCAVFLAKLANPSRR